jgi:phosphate transport system substrate-binding protein
VHVRIALGLFVAALTTMYAHDVQKATGAAPINAPFGGSALIGAGSTFINPLMSMWSKAYNQAHPDVAINYRSIGSGAGIHQFLSRTVDFGASDAPLNQAQLNQAGGPDKALHIPATMGAEAVIYNLPLGTALLKLTPDIVAGIYLGRITNWNDPAIASINPDKSLPNMSILVVHRSDGSGTTYIFTDYLSKVSTAWRTQVGLGTSVVWPKGIGTQGNEGVTNVVALTPGAIGYVELAYAKVNHLQYAQLRNRSGRYVAPSPETATAAAALLGHSLPADLRYSITDAAGVDAYPIAGTTWFLAYVEQKDTAKGRTLAMFMWWATHQGQSLSHDLFYAPLPAELVRVVEEQIKKLRCGGALCYSGT